MVWPIERLCLTHRRSAAFTTTEANVKQGDDCFVELRKGNGENCREIWLRRVRRLYLVMEGYLQPVTKKARAKDDSKLPKRFSKRTKPLLLRREPLGSSTRPNLSGG